MRIAGRFVGPVRGEGRSQRTSLGVDSIGISGTRCVGSWAELHRQCCYADALSILQAIDDGSLPEAVVLDYVLAETLNGLTTHAGHDAAVDLLDKIEENARFHLDSLSSDALATGKALFRQHRPLSFVDACLVAYMDTEGLGYLYAFDDDFDAADGVYRRFKASASGLDPEGEADNA